MVESEVEAQALTELEQNEVRSVLAQCEFWILWDVDRKCPVPSIEGGLATLFLVAMSEEDAIIAAKQQSKLYAPLIRCVPLRVSIK